MKRYFQSLLLGALLMLPTASFAQDHRYYDRDHKDYHEWNDNEDRAYRRYLEEKHVAYREWSKAKKNEQRDYWKWRHDHPDAH